MPAGSKDPAATCVTRPPHLTFPLSSRFVGPGYLQASDVGRVSSHVGPGLQMWAGVFRCQPGLRTDFRCGPGTSLARPPRNSCNSVAIKCDSSVHARCCAPPEHVTETAPLNYAGARAPHYGRRGTRRRAADRRRHRPRGGHGAGADGRPERRASAPFRRDRHRQGDRRPRDSRAVRPFAAGRSAASTAARSRPS